MNNGSQQRSVLLLGMKHSGKTTLGVRLSQRIASEFADLDEIIEHIYDADASSSCREIYRRHGREYFVDLEAQAAARLAESMASRPMVAALGGGTIENTGAMDALMDSGLRVYLKDDPTVLYERIMQNGLPAFLNADDPRASFDALYRRRTRLYEECAQVVVDIDGAGVEEAFERLLERLAARGVLPH